MRHVCSRICLRSASCLRLQTNTDEPTLRKQPSARPGDPPGLEAGGSSLLKRSGLPSSRPLRLPLSLQRRRAVSERQLPATYLSAVVPTRPRP